MKNKNKTKNMNVGYTTMSKTRYMKLSYITMSKTGEMNMHHMPWVLISKQDIKCYKSSPFIHHHINYFNSEQQHLLTGVNG